MKDVFQEYGILVIKIVAIFSLIAMIAAVTYDIELWVWSKIALNLEGMIESMH